MRRLLSLDAWKARRRPGAALIAELLSDEPHRGPRAPVWVQGGLIVLVGVIVGSILVAMYLPMFSVFEHIR